MAALNRKLAPTSNVSNGLLGFGSSLGFHEQLVGNSTVTVLENSADISSVSTKLWAAYLHHQDSYTLTQVCRPDRDRLIVRPIKAFAVFDVTRTCKLLSGEIAVQREMPLSSD